MVINVSSLDNIGRQHASRGDDDDDHDDDHDDHLFAPNSY